MKREKGAALIATLLILILLTALGLFLIATTTSDVKIGGITREYEVTFYTADSGIAIGAEVTALVLQNAATSAADLPGPWNAADITITTSPTEYWPTITMRGVEQIIGDSLPMGALDIRSEGLTRYHITGGAIEFGRAYTLVGGGQETGGVAMLFRIESKGKYQRATSEIEAHYRHVVGTAGG